MNWLLHIRYMEFRLFLLRHNMKPPSLFWRLKTWLKIIFGGE